MKKKKAPRSAAQAKEIEEMARLWLELPKNTHMDHLFYEWSRQVAAKEDAFVLANLFMEWWISKEDHALSKACIVLGVLLRGLEWKELLVLLESKLWSETLKGFKLPYAPKFYESFRSMVEERINWYVEEHSKNSSPTPNEEK